MDSGRGRLGLFGLRDFRLVWLGETASNLGNGITTVALPLIAVVTLHAGAFATGLLAAAVWLPWLVVGLPAGAWVDRLPLRPLMIICDLVSVVMYVSVPAAWWLDALTLTHLLIVALACGTAAVLFNTAYHTYVSVILDEDDLMEGNSKLQGGESATRVAGPGVGGLVAQALGPAVGLLLDAVTFVVSAACLLCVRARETGRRGPAGPRESLKRRISVGVGFVLRDPYLRTIVTAGALLNFALLGYQAVQVVFLVRTLGAGPVTVGVLVAAGSLGGVVGSLVIRPLGRRMGTARAMLAALLVAAPFALLMPLASPGAGLLLYFAGSFVLGAGVVACNVVLATFRQSYCPPRLLGRVVATTMVINHSAIPLGSLLGGTLGDLFGARTAMWVMTALLVPSSLLLLTGRIRTERDLPAGRLTAPPDHAVA